jgi:hypothetical protein
MNTSVHSGTSTREWSTQANLVQFLHQNIPDEWDLAQRQLLCYSYAIPSSFTKLFLITTMVKALEFITLMTNYFHHTSKIIFCLMSFIYYAIASLFVIHIFSSLFLFLTIFFLSFLLSCGVLHSRSWNICSQVMVVQNAR